MGENTDKTVCFNCYVVGHRETECMLPKRLSAGASLRRNKGKGGSFDEGVVDKPEDGDMKEGTNLKEKWFCEKCRKSGHTHWLCPLP